MPTRSIPLLVPCERCTEIYPQTMRSRKYCDSCRLQHKQELAREKGREYYQRWYSKNRERALAMKRQRMKEYRAVNPEKAREKTRRATKRLKDKIFAMYGKVCMRCGFEDERALTLDHIQHNGAEERKSLGERKVYRKAASFFQPEVYRILCMNCQFVTRFEHKRENQHRDSV